MWSEYSLWVCRKELRAGSESLIGELLGGRMSGRKDLTYVGLKGLRKMEAKDVV